MAEPTLELDASATGATTTYNIPFINAGTVDATKDIRFGDADSTDGAITNVTLPASGNAWAPECWDDDSDGADAEISSDVQQPDAGTARAMMFQLSTSDDVNFATAPRLTVFDDNTHTDTDEFIDGTTNHSSPFIKARGQTVNTAPSGQWWNEASDSALHILDNLGGGGIVFGNNAGNEENQALDGMNDYLYTSTTNIFTPTEEYFSIAASIPDDATTGVDSVDGVLTIRYTYT